MVPTRPPCCRQVTSANSARFFRNPAPILRMPKVKAILKARKSANVLEVGAGCLRNSLYLQSIGHKVHVVETHGIEDRFQSAYSLFRRRGGKVVKSFPRKSAFHVVVATFVIETVCDPGQRKKLICAIKRCLLQGGCLIMSVRGPRDLLTAHNSGVRCSDGYLTPNRTFSRAYTRSQLARFLRGCGFQRLDFLHKARSKQPKLLHVVGWK